MKSIYEVTIAYMGALCMFFSYFFLRWKILICSHCFFGSSALPQSKLNSIWGLTYPTYSATPNGITGGLHNDLVGSLLFLDDTPERCTNYPHFEWWCLFQFPSFWYIHSSFLLGGYQKPSYSRFVRRGDDEPKVVQALQFEIWVALCHLYMCFQSRKRASPFFCFPESYLKLTLPKTNNENPWKLAGEGDGEIFAHFSGKLAVRFREGRRQVIPWQLSGLHRLVRYLTAW